MFDIGFSELLIIALVGLIVLGPKRLPEVARTAGQWVGRFRRFVADVKDDFDRELQHADLAELKKLKQELDDTRRVMEETSSRLMEQASIEPKAATPLPEAEAAPNPIMPPLTEPPAARTRRTAKRTKKTTPGKNNTGRSR